MRCRIVDIREVTKRGVEVVQGCREHQIATGGRF
jgi:hypothetical protein